MASKTTTTQEKQRRQKIILAVGGVLLLVLAAFQLTKVLGGSSSSAATEPAATSTAAGQETAGSTVAPGSTAPGAGLPAATAPLDGGTTPLPPAGPAPKGSAYVVGVPVSPSLAPRAATGQLWSISRFAWKDPFVQQVKEAADSSSGAAPAQQQVAPQPAPSAEPDVVPGAAQAGTGVTAGAPKFATIAVNGTSAGVGLKTAFPAATRQFTLQALTPTSATVSIRGGGKTFALQLNQPVTLVNGKTKQRYRLQLLYVGAVPEKVTTFSP
jgi:hypothetical protein